MRQVWTTSEEQWLVGLAPTHTVAQLCEKLERNKASIISKLNALGVSALPVRRDWTSAEHRLMLSMLDDFTYEDIAKELGRSSSSVRQHAAHYCKVKPRKHMWNPTDEQKQRVRDMRAAGTSVPKIARLMRCTVWNVRQVVKDENLPYVYRNGTVRGGEF